MNRLSVRTTVFGGAALGLVAGAAVFGAVSSSATSSAPSKPGLVSVGTVPAASCAAGQELEHGVCVVHVEKVVVVPAPASAQGSSQDNSSADDDATKISDDATEISDDATETSDDAEEAAHEALEHASEADDDESDDSTELESADHS